jgi:hypothetical protein
VLTPVGWEGGKNNVFILTPFSDGCFSSSGFLVFSPCQKTTPPKFFNPQKSLPAALDYEYHGKVILPPWIWLSGAPNVKITSGWIKKCPPEIPAGKNHFFYPFSTPIFGVHFSHPAPFFWKILFCPRPPFFIFTRPPT